MFGAGGAAEYERGDLWGGECELGDGDGDWERGEEGGRGVGGEVGGVWGGV